MYGRLNERKINQKDYSLSCESARQELDEYIDQQSKRVNVDSAKKRAVLQHMDYEGFRQMVLGANIFPTKSKELYTFTKGENINPDMNKYFESKKESEGEETKPKDKQIAPEFFVYGKSELHCTNFRDFKKKFMSSYTPEFDREKTLSNYNLIKQQNEERINKIFNAECEGSIVVKIVNIFSQVLAQMREEGTDVVNETLFILIFYKTILKIPTMTSMTLIVLTKREKKAIADFLEQLKDTVQSPAEIEDMIKVVLK